MHHLTKLKELTAPLSPMVFNDLFCLSHPEIHTLSLEQLVLAILMNTAKPFPYLKSGEFALVVRNQKPIGPRHD